MPESIGRAIFMVQLTIMRSGYFDAIFGGLYRWHNEQWPAHTQQNTFQYVLKVDPFYYCKWVHSLYSFTASMNAFAFSKGMLGNMP